MGFRVKNSDIKKFLLENGYSWDENVYKGSGLILVEDNEEFISGSKVRLEGNNFRGPCYVQYSLCEFYIHSISGRMSFILSDKWMEYVLNNFDNKEENAQKMLDWCNETLVREKEDFILRENRLLSKLEDLRNEYKEYFLKIENAINNCKKHLDSQNIERK